MTTEHAAAKALVIALALFIAVPGIVGCNQTGRVKEAAGNSGYPDTPVELQQWYEEPPADQDAAALYERALGMGKMALQTSENWYDKIPEPGKPLPVDTRQGIESFLNGQQLLMDVLRDAAKRPRARYSIDLTKGVATELPHLAGTRAIVKSLALSALVNAEADKPDKAVEALTQAMHASESLADEPVLISQLVRAVNHTVTSYALADAFTRTRFTDAQLKQLEELFRAAEERDTFYRAFVGERVSGREAIRDGLDAYWANINEVSGDAKPLTEDMKAKYAEAGGAEKEEAYLVEALDRLIEAARLPVEQRFDAAEKLRPTFESPPESYYIADYQLPNLPKSVHSNLRDVSILRATRAALALERYRLQKGALPGTLQELVPQYLSEVPLDPSTAKPLTYVRQGDGYRIYSFGQNRKDDGGISTDEAKAKGLGPESVDPGIHVPSATR